ncbi:MAG: universal stress protein [Armatimonadota bacterium]|nr:universal stress protein [Armatimonadota bacterium]
MSQYTVVVAIANPDNVPNLMRIACMMACEFDGRVVAVTVVEMESEAPDPSSTAHDRMSQAYDVLEMAEKMAEGCDADFDGRLAVGRKVAEVLDDVADAEDAKLIVVGYSERLHPRDDAEFERLIDEIAAHAPCNLAVARFHGEVRFGRVLVPVRTRLNLDVRRDFVTAMHNQHGATVDVVHFASSQAEVEHMRDELEDWLVERGVYDWVNLRVDVAEQPAEAIVAASSEYDAVVLGTAPLHDVRRRYFGAVSEYVAGHARCSTFLLRTHDIRPGT